MIHAAMQAGTILSGELTVDLLASEVQRLTAAQRSLDPALSLAFLVDGFPRSFDNVRHFTARFGPPRALLLLTAADTTLRQRLRRRAAAAPGRPDDTDEVMQRRLATYHVETEQVVRWWKGEEQAGEEVELEGAGGEETTGLRWLREVDAERSIEEVYEDVRAAYTEWVQGVQPIGQQPLAPPQGPRT